MDWTEKRGYCSRFDQNRLSSRWSQSQTGGWYWFSWAFIIAAVFGETCERLNQMSPLSSSVWSSSESCWAEQETLQDPQDLRVHRFRSGLVRTIIISSVTQQPAVLTADEGAVWNIWMMVSSSSTVVGSEACFIISWDLMSCMKKAPSSVELPSEPQSLETFLPANEQKHHPDRSILKWLSDFCSIIGAKPPQRNSSLRDQTRAIMFCFESSHEPLGEFYWAQQDRLTAAR